MKLLLDACVLYPTVMREILLGAAKAGLYTPLWSDRILEEWARAARKLGAEGEVQARAEVALARASFPHASVQPPASLAARLYLPDENDVHVLAAAIHGSADGIVTQNAKDFPRNILAEEGLTRRDADGLLWEFASHAPDTMAQVVEQVRQEAERLSGAQWPTRRLLKKARLPRLAKALG